MERTKRHRKVCQCGCGQRFRAGRADQEYKNHAHQQHAYRQRQVIVEAERQAQAQEQERQRAEAERLAQARAEQEQAARLRAHLAHVEQEKESAQQRWREENSILDPCACGSAVWYVARVDMTHRKTRLVCKNCSARIDLPVAVTGKCDCSDGKSTWLINRLGDLKCQRCGKIVLGVERPKGFSLS